MRHFIKAQTKLLVTVLTLVVVLGVGATVAYLHDTTGAVKNTFDAAQLDTRIEEDLNTQAGNKQVVIVNTGKSDAYVRARVMVSGVKAGQLEIVDCLEKADKESAKVYLVMPNAGAGEKKWRQTDGDFYYYSDVLPGTKHAQDEELRKTSQLLQAVVIGDQVLKDDSDFLDRFSVTITHESVLAGDHADPQAAFEAAENKN